MQITANGKIVELSPMEVRIVQGVPKHGRVSCAELADRFDSTVGSIKVLVSRIREKFRSVSADSIEGGHEGYRWVGPIIKEDDDGESKAA